MKNDTPLAVLALASLLILGACAEDSDLDDPDTADFILQVDSIEPSILDADDTNTEDESVTVNVSAIPRTAGVASSELNDIVLEEYVIVFNPALPGLASFGARITAILDEPDVSTSVDVLVIPGGMKPLGVIAGQTVIGTITLSGEDLNGRSQSAEADFTITF